MRQYGTVLVALMLWFGQTTFQIVGGGECPKPDVVTQKLASLLPAASNADGSAAAAGSLAISTTPPGSVHLSRTPDGELEIVLLSGDGRWLDERRLKTTAGCEDLAAAVAVVIATWAFAPEPSVPERVELPRPTRPPTTTDEPSSVAARVQARATSRAGALASPRSSSTGDLRLGAVASSTGAEWAAGLRVGGGVILWGDRWGLGAVLAGTLPRDESVGTVSRAARWTRGYLGLGPEVTLLSGQVTLKAHLQALLGLLHVTGSGLEMTTSDTSFRFGSSAGIWSAGRGWGRVWPWIGANFLFWPGRDRLRVEGVDTEGTVPGLEGQIAAGVGIGLFP